MVPYIVIVCICNVQRPVLIELTAEQLGQVSDLSRVLFSKSKKLAKRALQLDSLHFSGFYPHDNAKCSYWLHHKEELRRSRNESSQP